MSLMRFVFSMLVMVAGGCDMPRDAEGTFDRLSGQGLRVGITQRSPWTTVRSGEFGGVEAALVERFAEQLGAEIEWTDGSESELFEMLEAGRLDLAIGGITDDSPWSDRVGLSRPYIETPNPVTGEIAKHVWVVRAGENRMLLAVDRFLQGHRAEANKLFDEAGR